MLTLVFDFPGGKLTLWEGLLGSYLLSSGTLSLLPPACLPSHLPV